MRSIGQWMRSGLLYYSLSGNYVIGFTKDYKNLVEFNSNVRSYLKYNKTSGRYK
jgi:hypothetical protein